MKKALVIRQLENEGKREPYQRLDGKTFECLLQSYSSPKEQLQALREELSFEKFMEMKDHWLKTLKTEWLIMGHLTEEEALKIVTESQNSLDYKPLNEDQMIASRLVQLPGRSVSEFEELNEDPKNPNSAVLCVLQFPKLRTYEDEAAISLLFHLMKEPFFNTLRTKEQLGYIV